MTDADKPIFAQAFNRLAVALREKEPDASTLRVYFEALRPFDVELVIAAAEVLVRSEWFPKVSEWATVVSRIDGERTEQQRKVLRDRLRAGLPPQCKLCEDTGWERLTDDRVRHCGCRQARRLEVLGVSPMPVLPPATADDSRAIGRVEALIRPVVKGMR